ASGTLGLTDAELDRVTAGTLVIGRNDGSAAGPLTVSANIDRPASTNVQLISGSTISVTGGTLNTAGGTFTGTAPTVTLSKDIIASIISGTATTVNVSGTAQVQDGVDVAANSGATVFIATGSYGGSVNTTAPSKSVTLAPGSSPGKVTINGNLVLDGND